MTGLAVMISAMPDHQIGCLTALRFCQAAVIESVKLTSIFFYGDAVLIARSTPDHNLDEAGSNLSWRQWAKSQSLRLSLCSAAAGRFNLTNLSTEFEVIGLGQWIANLQSADKLIQFR
jgi:tRNA 2-thiouridine synthesizing protein D